MTSYRGRRLDGSLGEFHQAIDLLDADTVPESYYLQVMASRGRPPDVTVVEVANHQPPGDPGPVHADDGQGDLLKSSTPKSSRF